MDRAVGEAALGPALVVDRREEVGVREQVAQREEHALGAAHVDAGSRARARPAPLLATSGPPSSPRAYLPARRTALSCRALCGSAWTRAHLTAGRGVARYTRALLGALAAAYPEDEWLAFVPGRGPVRAVPAGVRLVRHRAPGARRCSAPRRSRGRPRLDDLLGGGDRRRLGPGARAAGRLARRARSSSPSTTARSRSARPTSRATSACGTALARPRALARARRGGRVRRGAGRDDLARALGRRRDGRLARAADRPHRARAGAARRSTAARRTCCSSARSSRARRPTSSPTAYARARARGLEAELVVVGDGRIADRRPRRPPRAPAATTRARRAYAGALAVVAPSWLEGFGLPPVEAAALGTPSVVSDLPVFAETLGDGALRVAPGDAGGARGGARCASRATPRCAAALGAAARAGRRRYDWARSAARDARRPRRGGARGELHRRRRHPRLRARPRGAAGLDRAPPRPAAAGRRGRQRLARRRRRDRPRARGADVVARRQPRLRRGEQRRPRARRARRDACCSTPTASSSTAALARLAALAAARGRAARAAAAQPRRPRAAQRAPAARPRRTRCCPRSCPRARCRAPCASAPSRGAPRRAAAASGGRSPPASRPAPRRCAASARSTRRVPVLRGPRPLPARPRRRRPDRPAPEVALVHRGGHATGPALRRRAARAAGPPPPRGRRAPTSAAGALALDDAAQALTFATAGRRAAALRRDAGRERASCARCAAPVAGSADGMTQFWFAASTEEFTPSEMLEQAQAADRAGFDAIGSPTTSTRGSPTGRGSARGSSSPPPASVVADKPLFTSVTPILHHYHPARRRAVLHEPGGAVPRPRDPRRRLGRGAQRGPARPRLARAQGDAASASPAAWRRSRACGTARR